MTADLNGPRPPRGRGRPRLSSHPPLREVQLRDDERAAVAARAERDDVPIAEAVRRLIRDGAGLDEPQ